MLTSRRIDCLNKLNCAVRFKGVRQINGWTCREEGPILLALSAVTPSLEIRSVPSVSPSDFGVVYGPIKPNS